MSNILKGKVVNDATTVAYGLLTIPDASNVSLQLEIEDLGSFTGTVSVWASNDLKSSLDSDVGWIEMTTDHGFSGFVGLTAGALAGDVSAWADLYNANAAKYKVKVERTAGAANPDCHVAQKRSR